MGFQTDGVRTSKRRVDDVRMAARYRHAVVFAVGRNHGVYTVNPPFLYAADRSGRCAADRRGYLHDAAAGIVRSTHGLIRMGGGTQQEARNAETG